MITGMDCLRRWGRNDIEVVAPGRNRGFFKIGTGREGSSRWECMGSLEFFYYPAVVKKIVTSALYIKEVIRLPFSVFVGPVYLQQGVRSETNLTD